ncbi:MAG: EMC3/TMCO1 family protein [Candidatus Hodarchaeales archaeon]
MFFLENLTNFFVNLINTSLTILQSFPPEQPPLSSIFILIVSFFVSLGSTLVSRYMIDIDRLAVLTRETKKHSKLRMEMMKTADTKLKLKYEKNADKMKKMQSELTMMRMKPLLFTFLPLMFFFVVLSGFYRGEALPAVIPFSLPENLLLRIGENTYIEGWGKVFSPDYIWWYFGGSITFGSIFQKLAGLQPD